MVYSLSNIPIQFLGKTKQAEKHSRKNHAKLLLNAEFLECGRHSNIQDKERQQIGHVTLEQHTVPKPC